MYFIYTLIMIIPNDNHSTVYEYPKMCRNVPHTYEPRISIKTEANLCTSFPLFVDLRGR